MPGTFRSRTTCSSRLEDGGKGHIQLTKGASIEHIQLNTTDPNKEVDGERSSIKTTHPTLSDPAVRQAMKLLIDRASVQKYIYGRTGAATGNYVNGPAAVRVEGHQLGIQRRQGEGDLLDKAGYKPGPDGIRAKDGNKLDYVFQTSINGPRQQNQEIVKAACKQAGINIKHQGGAVIGVLLLRCRQPRHLHEVLCRYADVHHAAGAARSGACGCSRSCPTEIADKANKWSGRNITRYRNPEYDKTWNAASRNSTR